MAAFVEAVKDLYHRNPFHNFEHASHVAMAVTKLLSRIVVAVNENNAPTYVPLQQDQAFGIISDPMMQLAAFFAAVVRDVDHPPGVPNTSLATEDDAVLAEKYGFKSIAEQNSVDMAWNLLMQDEYKDFRYCICSTTTEELKHFRQLVVQMVMATDVLDKELGVLRRGGRWTNAFDRTDEDDTAAAAADPDSIEKSTEQRNRKATIVIEHLIQASDVSHTMQHWHVYIKWNESLFMEIYHAYKQGRLDKDPSEGWYQGEMGFFDFYVIPLAKKLETCGVFGVSSDEFLSYATDNRKEWELKGEQIVQDYVAKYNSTLEDAAW
jgi:hypothetical protein